jgi:hypothetical protein
MPPSLASATNSRIESASRHVVTCRVATDYVKLSTGEKGNTDRMLMNNKMDYCMNKNEVVIGLGRALTNSTINLMKAYPAVVTTVGKFVPEVQFWVWYLSTRPKAERTTIVEAMVLNPAGELRWQGLSEADKKYIQSAHTMFFMGISMGLAYAHPNSGDTAGAVMVGGLQTVCNGPQPMNTGDPVAWVTPSEYLYLFDHKSGVLRDDPEFVWGTDIAIDPNIPLVGAGPQQPLLQNANGVDNKKRTYQEMQNGRMGNKATKTNLFLLIPMIVPINGIFPTWFKDRAVGRSLSNAMPYDMFDLQISRLSM